MADSSFPSDRQDKFMLRLPDGMRDRVKAAAEANNRSMNAEIVARLEASFLPPSYDPVTKAIVAQQHEIQVDEWKHMMADLRDLLSRHKP